MASAMENLIAPDLSMMKRSCSLLSSWTTAVCTMRLRTRKAPASAVLVQSVQVTALAHHTAFAREPQAAKIPILLPAR